MTKKVIVVTGANRGIGKEICKQLAVAGHTVILTGRDLVSAENTADTLSGDIHTCKLDVRDQQSVDRFIEKIQEQFTTIDVLINNAGVMGKKPMKKLDICEIEAVQETNFFGPIRVSKALLPLLEKSSSPRIINVSSGMAQNDGLIDGGMAAYRLSKASLNAFTIMLATELKEQGVFVNAFCPGWVRTDMGGLLADRSVSEGADTGVWLATNPSVETGKFFRDRKVIAW